MAAVALAAGLACLLVGPEAAERIALAQEATDDGRGQIIVMREVLRRPAYRQGFPAPPFAVRTRPEIDTSDTQEISPVVLNAVPSSSIVSDLESAKIAVGAPLFAAVTVLGDAGGGQPGLVGMSLASGLQGGIAGLQQLGGLRGVGGGIAGPVSGAGRAVTRATSGIGSTITRALAPR